MRKESPASTVSIMLERIRSLGDGRLVGQKVVKGVITMSHQAKNPVRSFLRNKSLFLQQAFQQDFNSSVQLAKTLTQQIENTQWMDENYNLLPHGVNFQDAIFPDTQENRRMFSSLFQFSNCSQGQQLATFSSDWEVQEDTRLMCSSVQKALFEEEDHVKKLQQKVATLEKRNKQLRERVKKVKRSLRQARKHGRRLELLNRKLSEKLAAAAGLLPHINALGREPAGAAYLRG